MASFQEVGALIVRDAKTGAMSTDCRTAVDGFFGEAAARVAAGQKPGVTLLVSSLPPAAVAFLANQPSLLLGAADTAVRGLAKLPQNGQRDQLLSDFRQGLELVSSKVSQAMEAFPKARDGAGLAALVRAQAQAIDAVDQVRGDWRTAMKDAARAMYPDGMDRDVRRAMDAAVVAVMAEQVSVHNQPFSSAVNAHDFESALTARSPHLRENLDLGVGEAVARQAHTNTGVYFGPDAPEVRESGSTVFKVWRLDGKPHRSPFDGPAVERTDHSAGTTEQSFLWRGQRLGASFTDAIEAMREDYPKEFQTALDSWMEQVDPAALDGERRAFFEEQIQLRSGHRPV